MGAGESKPSGMSQLNPNRPLGKLGSTSYSSHILQTITQQTLSRQGAFHHDGVPNPCQKDADKRLAEIFPWWNEEKEDMDLEELVRGS